eukprot:XP_017949509.1 PREDICTED: CD109 antigen-like [Xenopus tropicalis]
MPVLWPPFVKHVICFLFILHCSDARPSYMISVPTFVIPGVSTTLAVHWFGQNHSEITVTAEIWDNGISLANSSKVFQKDILGLLSIPPLSVISSSASYLIRVYGTAGNELLFSNNYTMQLETKNVSLLIETDKSAYKPGQTVKIRIISIRRDLRPYKGLVNVVIRDPKSNIIKQWLQRKPELGVITEEFLLSVNAMAGTWRVHAETDMTENIEEISVIHFESGIISVELPLQNSVLLIIIEAVYQNITQKWQMHRDLGISSSAQIQLPDSPAQVGTPFDVRVKTTPEIQNLYYVIMARGIIVAAEKTNSTTFTLTPEYSWAPSAVLMVYFLNFNNNSFEIIQASRTIDIKGMFENKDFVNSLTDGIISYDGILLEEFIPELFIIREEIEPPANVPIVFPETWIWLETNISSGIRTSLPVTVPNAVTSWTASAFVISDVLGLGLIEESVELQAFQPFFITLNAPYAVTRGEQFILRVLLYNCLEENLQVNVSLETNNAFDIIIPENDNGAIPWLRNVSIRSKESEIILFPVSPKQLGVNFITVRAMSRTASDIATQKILVKAEGVQNFYTQNLILEVNGTGSVSQQLSFTFPTNVVGGSEQASVSVVGDFLGPSIKGLESLIRMPYGCGEQNMINFAPIIYVLQYLTSTSQQTEDIRRRAISFMEQGYQSELNYRRGDDSFSAFGDRDSSGSSWLSAFVVRCFLQARTFINISPEILNRTVEWLIQQQDPVNGKFLEPGHVFNSRLQGGLNGPITLTAYVLTSLLENSQYSIHYASRVGKAVQYLEKEFEGGISSNYTLSVVAYALSVANSTKASAALTQLNSRTSNNGKYQKNQLNRSLTSCKTTKMPINSRILYGHIYCSSPTGASNYWQPPSADIETAAYALLSHCQQNRIAEGVPIMNWLVQQRNNLGGYSSTQDTIVALWALAQFMAVAPSLKETSLTVSVTGPGPFAPKSFQITNDNLLAVQIQQIDISYPIVLNVSAVGRGIAIFQVCFSI